MTHERRSQIVEMVQKNGMINNKELMEKFSISIETVRRDLKYLEDQGYLKCVYGGAVRIQSEDVRGESPFAYEGVKICHYSEKDAIARAAVKLIQDGDTIFLDEGTTVLAMSRYLGEVQNVTVITNSIQTAVAMSEVKGCTVVIPGGILRRGSMSIVGIPEEGGLGRFNIDKAFVGVVGITETHFTDYPIGGGYLRYQAIRSSKKTIALADHSKFGMRAAMNVSRIEELDVVITDTKTEEKHIRRLEQAGVQVIAAGVE